MAPELFPTDPTGLPEAGRPALLELADGDVLDLQVGPVAKRLGEATVRMLGHNGSIPGPTLKVRQGSEIVVQVTSVGAVGAVGWRLRFRPSAEASAWRQGARGERRTARRLRRLVRRGYVAFHDLAMPGSRANIDCDDSWRGGRGEV